MTSGLFNDLGSITLKLVERKRLRLIKLGDKPFLFQFRYDRVINDVLDFQRRTGLAGDCILNLNVHAFAGYVGNSVKQLGVDLIGGFEVRFVVLPGVFGEDLFAFFFARLKKVHAFGQSHDQAFDDRPVTRQVRLGCGSTDIWKRITFLKLGRADQDALRHPFGEMKNSRWRGEAGNLTRAKGRGPLAGAAYLEDRDVFIGFEAEVLQKNSGDDVGGTADAADANALAFELLRRFDRVLNDQLIGQSIHEAGDSDQVGAAYGGAGDRAAGAVAEFELTRDENGNIG
jgi:hypothetical protein